MPAEAIFWSVLFILLLAVEMMTTQLVSVWFAAGSLAAFIAAMCGGSFTVQLILFVIVSAALLPVARIVWKKRKLSPTVKTNADSVIGMIGVVTEDVDNLKETGRVKVNGLSWSARMETGNFAAVGTAVRICRIDGVKLLVEPAEQEEK